MTPFLKRLGGILIVGYGIAALLAVALHGQVTFTPQPINFGSVKLGASSPVDTVVLTNTGTGSFTFCGNAGCTTATGVSKSRMAGSTDFSYVGEDGKCGGTFVVGATCKIWYRFRPTSVGAKTGSNVVATSAGEFPANFTGTGLDTVTAPPPNKPPSASFTVSCTQLTCSFISTSTDADGTISASRWAFGDAGTATTANAAHTYAVAGAFTVTLTVTDNAGASTAATQTVTVTAPPPPPPPSDTARAWTLASRVHTTADSVCAHATVTYAGACGTAMAIGSKGSITGGPGTDAGWTFWLIRYDNAVTGWTRQALLALDTLGVPPPPPGPVAGTPNYVGVNPTAFTIDSNGAAYVSAFVYDSFGHVLPTPLVWSVADTNIARVLPNTITQFAYIVLKKPGVTTVTATAGSHAGNIVVTVTRAAPPPPPPPPVAPVFGISSLRWQANTQCPPTVGTSCTRVFPIFDDVDGHTIARDSVVATFLPP